MVTHLESVEKQWPSDLDSFLMKTVYKGTFFWLKPVCNLPGLFCLYLLVGDGPASPPWAPYWQGWCTHRALSLHLGVQCPSLSYRKGAQCTKAPADPEAHRIDSGEG